MFSLPHFLIIRFARSMRLIGSELFPMFRVLLFALDEKRASTVALAVSCEKLYDLSWLPSPLIIGGKFL